MESMLEHNQTFLDPVLIPLAGIEYLARAAKLVVDYPAERAVTIDVRSVQDHDVVEQYVARPHLSRYHAGLLESLYGEGIFDSVRRSVDAPGNHPDAPVIDGRIIQIDIDIED